VPQESLNPARIGSVELDQITLIQAPRLDESIQFHEMSERLRDSEAIVNALRKRGDWPLDRLLTEALNALVATSRLDGMMIATDEGFPVAASEASEQGEVLAAICCLFATTVRRTQSEGLIPSVEEMTLRGFGGEQIIMRFLPGLEKRYFLVAWSTAKCSHRRATATALKTCTRLLAWGATTSRP
jgi:predicted regulator of Ras-like GTPase activity (Roadblock/LC7/MglB family)